MARNIIFWLGIVAFILFLVNQMQQRTRGMDYSKLDYTSFIQQVEQGNVASVEIDGSAISGKLRNGDAFNTHNPGDAGLVGDLLNNGVQIVSVPPETPNFWLQLLISWFPLILIIGLWLFFSRSVLNGMGGSRNPLNFGKNKARMIPPDQIKTRFEDVAGVDEAKEEVSELVDFLRTPDKYQKMGGKIPKGILMVGQPGTGKTLLAKAIAGEAGVPFFTISGSDFVEMFVGVGASRVRDLFSQAKNHAPCIVFVDEIDAVGRHRGAGMGGGNDEREQTLNQMLVEMDGFEGHEGIIVIAATNRPDVLDPALLRPGRFDRQVTVALPDLKGREHILRVHAKPLPLKADVDLEAIARGTPGFSGADLANLVNEAALIGARNRRRKIGKVEFDAARDKIIMGVERRTMVMDDKERELTAYHEAGHAIVGYLVEEHDPVYKVSIIPRGRALGVTMYLPEKDNYSYSKMRLISQLCSLYGGRIAEELIFGKDKVTTGAQNDIQRATHIARNMVTKWGFSDSLGPLLYEDDEDEVFLGKSVTRHKNISDETMHRVDSEVRTLIDTCYARATTLLKDNLEQLHLMSKTLLQYETIEADQVRQIMEGEPITEPAGWAEANKRRADSAADKKPARRRKRAPTATTKPALEAGWE